MDEVAEVKARLEITEVVSGYLPLKQAGRNLKAPCPFHEEKSASFMVSPEKGIYHCFGCGEGGDIFNFVMKMEGLDFRSALELLARKAGVELKAKSGEAKQVQKLRDRLLAAHALAVKYYQATLIKNPKALEYVRQARGLSKEIIRDFGIGYAPDSWEALTSFLLGQGFTQRELLQGGLASQKPGRATVYDMFRGRICFPICDREGRPIGFTARVLDDGLPKYLNTPQTPLYDKSQVIYGLHLAKAAVRTTGEVVLVEGNMDVVASHQAGVRQVVAASGTALTLEQLRTLSKLTKTVKLAFDSDRAGLAATERAIELGQKLGLTLRMVVLPEGFKDADELIKAQGAEAWTAAIAGAQYIVDYLFDRFASDYDLGSAIGKRGYTDRLVATLQRLGDPVEQDHYIKLLAEKTGVAESAVKTKVEGKEVTSGQPVMAAVARADDIQARRAVEQVTGRRSLRQRHEELLLGLNLWQPAVRACLVDLSAADFVTADARTVFEALRRHRALAGDKLVEKLAEAETYAKGLLLVAEEEFSEGTDIERQSQAFELARTVLLEANAEHKGRLTAEIRSAEASGNEALKTELLREFQRIIESEA